jgi:DNA-binding XRE family transcriptional regulator
MTTAMTGLQLKAARAVLGISIREMARLIGFNKNSVVDAEGRQIIPERLPSAGAMSQALEARGVTFIHHGRRAGILFEMPAADHNKDNVPVSSPNL